MMEDDTTTTAHQEKPSSASTMMMDDSNTEDDQVLSNLMSTSLNVSLTKEVLNFNNVDYLLPKKLHGLALYKIEEEGRSNTSSENNGGASTTPTASNHKEQEKTGVPGFPDFPDCWSGEEGWAVWKRVPAGESSSRNNVCYDDDRTATTKGTPGKLISRHTRRCQSQQQRRSSPLLFRRNPVNPVLSEMPKYNHVAIIMKKRHLVFHQKEKLPLSAKSSLRRHKMARRQKRIEKMRLKRSIVDISKGLEALSCNSKEPKQKVE